MTSKYAVMIPPLPTMQVNNLTHGMVKTRQAHIPVATAYDLHGINICGGHGTLHDLLMADPLVVMSNK